MCLENIIKAGEIAMKTLEIRGNSDNVEWKSDQAFHLFSSKFCQNQMAEPYEAKVSRTVLRRGGTSNSSSLFGNTIYPNEIIIPLVIS